MNSIVQCLSNTVLLRDYLVSKQFLKDIRSESRGDLIKSFSDLLVELWHGDQQVANTSSFKAQVQRFAPRFMGYNQQDAQEFLRYLLEGLHQDVNQVLNKTRKSISELSDDMPTNQKARESWRLYLSYENSKIVDLFVGQLRSVLSFSGCGHQSTTFEVFWDLSIPLATRGTDSQHSIQLTQCIEYFMREEILDGDEMPMCTKCNIRRRCTKRYSIQKFPKVLVLHLKRFGPNERFRNKLGQSVDFPIVGMDLSQFSESVGNQITTYDLYSVSNHSGTLQSGHYTAMCRHPYNNHWYLYNDSVVTPISPARIVSGQAYVLFYEQSSR
ncbi:ubiquitin carboxyl-terminal hydrolase 2-like [Lycorma delicatula]|uniref:ubiquitin carboxyl-terminal hydrolase 2-like n=1 Tax=Lycorma delicatula TaxID=130591 RepID=UPI003F50D8DB